MGIFSDLPRHNQIEVLKKVDFRGFVKFKKCSNETMETTKDFRHRLILNTPEIYYNDGFLVPASSNEKRHLPSSLTEPIRLEADKFVLESKLAKFAEFKAFCKETQMKASELDVRWQNGNNDPRVIDYLIKILKSEALRMDYYDSYDLVSLSELKKLKKIVFCFGIITPTDFLPVKAPTIRIISEEVLITPQVIDKLLKEWLEKTREIKELEIFPVTFSSKFLDGLEFSLLWSPESHESSPFAQSQEIQGSGKIQKIFTLERKQDNHKLFILFRKYSDTPELGGYTEPLMTVREYENIQEIEEYIREKINKKE